MAWSILCIAVLFFALRGFFLGLSGVVSRLLGIVSGYFCAIIYRDELATIIRANIPNNLPDMVLQVISSAVLFFAAMLLISIVVSISFKTLGKLIPPLQPLLDKQSLTGRLGGATGNSLVAIALVLTVLWGITAFTGKVYAPEPLQSAANTLGNALFQDILENQNITVISHQQSSQSNSAGTRRLSRGTATITSESNPEKKLSIETMQEAVELIGQDPTLLSKVSDLIQNPDIQELLNDPEIRDLALEQLKENPEEVKRMLQSPDLQKMLQQFETMQ